MNHDLHLWVSSTDAESCKCECWHKTLAELVCWLYQVYWLWPDEPKTKDIRIWFLPKYLVICPKCIDKKSGYTFMNLIFWSQIRLRYQIRKHLMPKDQAQCKRWLFCKRIVILFWWFSSLEVNPGLCGAFYPFPNHSLKIIKHFVI